MKQATITPAIDKRQVVQSIRILMDYAGIDVEELKTLSANPSPDKEGEPSPEWRAMIDESLEDIRQDRVHGPFNTLEEMMQDLQKD